MSSPEPGITLHAGSAVASISPAEGGRLTALAIDGVDVLKTSGVGSVTWGSYPMVPWAGRLRDGVLQWRGAEFRLPTHLIPPHALHGTVLEAAWDVVEFDEASATLATGLGADWPFDGLVEQRFELSAEALRVTLTVEARDEEFPAIVGWHPWFLRQLRGPDGTPVGAPAEVDLPAGGMLVRGPDYLPTGEIARPIPPGPWDDCFVEVSAPPRLRWNGALEMALESDAPYWVCYTQPPDAVCIEPQTGPPNGLNTGPYAVVAPGSPLVASMTFRWRRLPIS